jgi:hypothetical protein
MHYKVMNLSTGECWKNGGIDEVWSTKEEAETLVRNSCRLLPSMLKPHYLEIVETEEPVHNNTHLGAISVKWAAANPTLIQ